MSESDGSDSLTVGEINNSSAVSTMGNRLVQYGRHKCSILPRPVRYKMLLDNDLARQPLVAPTLPYRKLPRDVRAALEMQP